MGDEQKQKEVVSQLAEKFGISEQELSKYLNEYAASTKALAEANVKIATGEFKFNNDKIVEYTQEHYAQPVITEKLFEIFDAAQEAYNSKKKCKSLED